MSVSFSDSELINIAIGIEQRGIAFYDTMTRSTDNDSARDTFQNLADMEREHMLIFQGMLGEADKHQSPETYTEEYTAYLNALIDSAVFTDDLVDSQMATQADSDIQALELGISAEKDSMLFYYEMREIMPQRARQMINKIIAEEKAHLRQLSGLKQKLAAT